MYHTHENNGALTFHLEGDDRADLENFLRQSGDDSVQLRFMLDHFGYVGNATLMPVSPKDVGALTDSPMFTDHLEHTRSGDVLVLGNVWWYPAYEQRNFMEVLMEQGHVSFTRAAQAS